jgi:hypothetical protein
MNALLPQRALLVLATACLIAAPAFAETVKGNGVIRDQARSVSGFSAVGLGIPAKVEVRLGTTEGITVQADENLLPLIETSVNGRSLEIKPVRKNLSLESKSIRIVVQAKQIEQLDVGGSGSISSDAIKGSKLQLNIGGSGAVEVKRADIERISVAIGGSGSARIGGGAAKLLHVSIGGSGDANAAGLVADQAEISVAGSGDAQVAARNALTVTIAGSGNITYWGDAAVTQTVVGSGRVKRAGPLPQ